MKSSTVNVDQFSDEWGVRELVNCGNRRCEFWDEGYEQCCRGEYRGGEPLVAGCERYRPRMRVVLFTDVMAELIKMDLKWQTIRRRANCVPGDLLSLRRWTGRPYQSKQEVVREVVCSAVWKVRIGAGMGEVSVEGRGLVDEEGYGGVYRFAVRDGFGSFVEMQRWFEELYGLPFEGEVISWVMV